VTFVASQQSLKFSVNFHQLKQVFPLKDIFFLRLSSLGQAGQEEKENNKHSWEKGS